MRHIIFWLVLAPWCLFAQPTYYALRTQTDTIVLALKVEAQQLGIAQHPLLKASNLNQKLLNLQQITLKEADVIIAFELKKINEADFYYTVKMEILSKNGEILEQQQLNVQPTLEDKHTQATTLSHFVLQDALEYLLEYGKDYKLVLTTSLLGSIDCNMPRPAFTFKKQSPHYLAAGIGIGLIGISQWVYNDRDKEYDIYTDFWKQGSSQTIAQPSYDTAKTKEKTGKTLLYIGWAITGLDAAWMTYRAVKIKKKQRLYDEYCKQDGLSWRLMPYFEEYPRGTALAGATFSIRF